MEPISCISCAKLSTFHSNLQWTLQHYPGSLCYHVPYLAVEMFNDSARKTKSILLLFIITTMNIFSAVARAGC